MVEGAYGRMTRVVSGNQGGGGEGGKSAVVEELGINVGGHSIMGKGMVWPQGWGNRGPSVLIDGIGVGDLVV